MGRKRHRLSVREYVILGFLILLLCWLLWLLVGIVRKEEIARRSAHAAKEELAALTLREETLQKNIDELATLRGQEATLRETYGVARPGEEVIIVLPAEETASLKDLSWWDRLMGYFGL